MTIRHHTELLRAYYLAEHVELQKDGWWIEAIDRTLAYELLANSGGLTSQRLTSMVVSRLGAESDRATILSRIHRMLDDGRIVTTKEALFLSQGSLQEMENLNEEVLQLESESRNLYEERFSRSNGISHAPAWDDFRTKLLIPLVHELGAQTLTLLRGEAALPATRAAETFLTLFEESERNVAQSRMVEFLDPSVPSVRRLILANLTNYMLVSSSALDRHTLTRLHDHDGGRRPKFNLVLDTNVVFSILNLHRNPLNDASSAVLSLVSSTRGYADITLWILPETLDEATNALTGARQAAPQGRVTQKIAAGADRTGEISGLVGRYLEVGAKSALSPSAYFDPYINGLEILLEERGIKVLADEASDLRHRPSVRRRIDDAYSWEYDREYGRTRESVTHDVIAMEFVREKRGGRISQIARADWWFVTLDLRLQRQEARGLQGTKSIALCVNPAELAQMLRFWVPRSVEMEQALIGAIRMPFSFFAYDRRIERTCMRILDAVSRYANVEDFSEDVVERLLTDENLRTAMASAGESESSEQIERTLSQYNSENEQRVHRLESQTRDLQRRIDEMESTSQRAGSIQLGINESKKRMQNEIARLSRERNALQAKYKVLLTAEKDLGAAQEEIRELQEQRRSEAEERRRVDHRVRLVLFAFISVLSGTALVFLLWVPPISVPTQASVWMRLFSCFVALVAWGFLGLGTLRLLKLKDGKLATLWKRSVATTWGWLGAAVIATIATFTFAPPPSP